MADKFLEAARALHTCLCLQVAAMPEPTRPKRCCLMVGADFELGVAITEDMCKCGTAWVRVVSFVPSSTFPNPQEEATHCAPEGWSLTLELGIARCPPIGDARVLATCDEMDDYTELVMGDAAAMRRAVLCCFGPGRANRLFQLGSWEAFGPEGMCGGGKMTVQAQILRCNECP